MKRQTLVISFACCVLILCWFEEWHFASFSEFKRCISITFMKKIGWFGYFQHDKGMIYYRQNFRKWYYSSKEKHIIIQSIDTGQWKNSQIFLFPIMTRRKVWKMVRIKIWIILRVLNKRLHSNPSLSSVLSSVDLDSGLMQVLWMLLLFIVHTKNEEDTVILWLAYKHNSISMYANIYGKEREVRGSLCCLQ